MENIKRAKKTVRSKTGPNADIRIREVNPPAPKQRFRVVDNNEEERRDEEERRSEEEAERDERARRGKRRRYD